MILVVTTWIDGAKMGVDTVLYAHRKFIMLQPTLLDGKDRRIRTASRLLSVLRLGAAVWMESDSLISELQMLALTSST